MSFFKNSTKQDITLLAILSIMLSMTFFICGPIQMYITNITELWFSIFDMIGVCLITGLLAVIIVFLIGLPMRGWMRTGYVCLLLGLGIALYIQGNFVITDYGVLDGSTIAWEEYTFTAIWNSALWLVCLAAPFVVVKHFQKTFKKYFQFAACCIIAVQLLSLVILCVTTDFSIYQADKYSISDKDLYSVGDEENVVIFVLDSFDADYLNSLWEFDPDLLKPLDGFTYFQNATCSYPTTKASMPLILTGQYYENEQPYSDYIEEAYSNTDYYQTLRDAGYAISLYTSDLFISDFVKEQFLNNSIDSQIKVRSQSGLEMAMLRFTAFRYFPHIAKQFVWFYSGLFEELKISSDSSESLYAQGQSGNLAFFQGLTGEGLKVIQGEKAYHVIHLVGTHQPYNLNADVTPVTDGVGTWCGQARASLNIVYEYIRQLKDLGIYDDTMIMITADHGHGNLHLSSPIMFVKRFGETGELKTSDVPVSQVNIQATVMEELGLNANGHFGISMYDVFLDNAGMRRYLKYKWDNNWDAEYMPDMVEYDILPDGSYMQTGQTYTSEGIKETNPYEYHLNDEILFTEEADGIRYFRSGVSNVETDFVWSLGHTSQMYLDMGNEATTHLNAMIHFSYVHHGSQQVIIKSQGEVLFDGIVSNKDSQISFLIPERCFRDGILELDFEYPEASSVITITRNESDDPRVLAVAFYKIQFSEVN